MTPLVFRKKVLSHYAKFGRDFPWRRTTDPYRILVSEIMLQQTQTHRVVPKYEAFIKKFPTLKALAKAPLSEVLKLWQGLGYNRRALMLHRAASAAMRSQSGGLPETYEGLLDLPGIGPYTAGAVMTFAYNKRITMIETNIRSALIHEFFPNEKKVDDKELIPILERCVASLPRGAPGAYSGFYQALMDYGAFIKQKHPNPSRRSAHHVKQSKFEGSRRQVRGRLLKILLERPRLTAVQLADESSHSVELVTQVAQEMLAEGFLIKRGRRYTLS